MNHEGHKEHQEGGNPARSGWWVVVLICAALMGWGLIQYATIRDTPRRWDFDVLPDAPGESAYSTSRPALRGPAPPQMAPLPEARATTGVSGTTGVSPVDPANRVSSKEDSAGETPAVPAAPVVPAGGRP